MKGFFKSFVYAWKGIKSTFGSERNMKVHLSIAILVVISSCFLKITTIEWIICLLCIGSVFSAEMFNTSIETLTDKASPEQDKLAGKAKDISAGAVLVTAITSATVGLIIFLPKIISLF